METDIYSDLAPATAIDASAHVEVMAKVRIQFRTVDGVLLRGDYFPVHVEMAPIVIMAPGVSCSHTTVKQALKDVVYALEGELSR